MLAFDNILNRIEQEISQLTFPYPPKSLYEPIEYILALGGKRIRPACVLMACNLYTDSVEKALRPAVGLEVFHNFTLLHDDLMDHADKRRNKPTVHTVWDANTAILSGDAMLIAAYQLMIQTESDALKKILDLFTVTALEICGGQQYDMEFETRDRVTEAEYLEMIRLKTAVLLGCAFKMGALLANAPETDAEHLYQYGINIGLAFQLQDDLLDVYGNTATFGKNIGGDIISNKKTFMLIRALATATPSQQAELTRWLEMKTFDPQEKIAAVTAIYNEAGVKTASEVKIQEYYDSAMSHLESLSVDPSRTHIIKEVCSRLMNRQS